MMKCNKIMFLNVLVPLLLSMLLAPVLQSTTQAETIVIDAVVATVAGEPITLSEVLDAMPEPKPSDLDQARTDPSFKSAMETLITEKLLELEATNKKVSVADTEINNYINSVAQRNGLSSEEFAEALKNEGKSLELFQRNVKAEILKSKLASSLIQDGAGVSEKEVSDYIEQFESQTPSGSGKQVKLRQILLSYESSWRNEADQKCQELYRSLQSGSDFAELARLHSQSPEASEGGALDVVAEKDLNAAIFDAILTLENGEFSQPVSTDAGCHIFLLEGRYDSTEKSDKTALHAQVKELLERQKMEEKFQTFFSTEVYKNHTIERKI